MVVLCTGDVGETRGIRLRQGYGRTSWEYQESPLAFYFIFHLCYVKVKGLDLDFLRFFLFSVVLDTFLPLEDKNPTSAISCSPFYVKLSLFYFSIKKSDTVIGGELIS